jgi:hypothetical protein
MRLWLTRTWIMQEMAIPRQDPLFLCGSANPISWTSFLAARDIAKAVDRARTAERGVPIQDMRRSEGYNDMSQMKQYLHSVKGCHHETMHLLERDPTQALKDTRSGALEQTRTKKQTIDSLSLGLALRQGSSAACTNAMRSCIWRLRLGTEANKRWFRTQIPDHPRSSIEARGAGLPGRYNVDPGTRERMNRPAL